MPPFTSPTAEDLSADIDRLGETALRIKAQRDELLSALRGMIDAYWRGSEDSDDEHAPSMVKAALAAIAKASAQ